MQALGVLIDGGSRLGAAIAVHVVEFKRIDAEFAGDAFEPNPVVDLFRCVIAHIFIVVLLAEIRLRKRCWPFGSSVEAAGALVNCPHSHEFSLISMRAESAGALCE